MINKKKAGFLVAAFAVVAIAGAFMLKKANYDEVFLQKAVDHHSFMQTQIALDVLGARPQPDDKILLDSAIAAQKDLRIIRALFKAGLGPDEGYFRQSVIAGNAGLADAFLEAGANPNIDQGRPLAWAALNNFDDLLKVLLKHHADLKLGKGYDEPVLAAVYGDNAAGVRLLTAAGADPDGLYGSPLIVAAARGSHSDGRNLNVMHALIEGGANPDGVCDKGALVTAANVGDFEAAALLLDADARAGLDDAIYYAEHYAFKNGPAIKKMLELYTSEKKPSLPACNPIPS